MRPKARSFLRLFAAMGVAAIILSALPTGADLDFNRLSEFCVFADGRVLLRENGSDCVPDYAAVAGRFLSYFAFFGGALIGPFGLYVVMLAIQRLRQRRRT